MLLLKGEYMPLSMHIYIYIEREREREREKLLVCFWWSQETIFTMRNFSAFLDMRRNRIGLITALENI